MPPPSGQADQAPHTSAQLLDAPTLNNTPQRHPGHNTLYEPPADWGPPQDEAPPLPGAAPRPPLDVAGGGIIIQHVDTLIVNTVPGHPPLITGMEEDKTAAGE